MAGIVIGAIVGSVVSEAVGAVVAPALPLPAEGGGAVRRRTCALAAMRSTASWSLRPISWVLR